MTARTMAEWDAWKKQDKTGPDFVDCKKCNATGSYMEADEQLVKWHNANLERDLVTTAEAEVNLLLTNYVNKTSIRIEAEFEVFVDDETGVKWEECETISNELGGTFKIKTEHLEEDTAFWYEEVFDRAYRKFGVDFHQHELWDSNMEMKVISISTKIWIDENLVCDHDNYVVGPDGYLEAISEEYLQNVVDLGMFDYDMDHYLEENLSTNGNLYLYKYIQRIKDKVEKVTEYKTKCDKCDGCGRIDWVQNCMGG